MVASQKILPPQISHKFLNLMGKPMEKSLILGAPNFQTLPFFQPCNFGGLHQNSLKNLGFQTWFRSLSDAENPGNQALE